MPELSYDPPWINVDLLFLLKPRSFAQGLHEKKMRVKQISYAFSFCEKERERKNSFQCLSSFQKAIGLIIVHSCVKPHHPFRVAAAPVCFARITIFRFMEPLQKSAD